MENILESSDAASILLKISTLESTVHNYQAFCQQLVISNRNLDTEVKKLKDDNDDILNSLYNIEAEMIRNIQYNRRENLEFVNIPEAITQKELEPLLIKIFNSMNIPIQSYDIAAVHRNFKHQPPKKCYIKIH